MDFARKVLFSYFLPYGFLGRNALVACAKLHPNSFVDYSVNHPVSQLAHACDSSRNSVLIRVTAMEKGGYLTDGSRKFSTSPIDKFSYHRITPSSLYLLSGTPNIEDEPNFSDLYDENYNRRKKEKRSYRPSKEIRQIYQYLYDYATDAAHSEQEEAEHKSLFYDSVCAWDVTPLAVGTEKAPSVHIALSDLNNLQHYRCWRTANINTMFRLAGFLCHLDRRPIDAGWTFNGLCTNQRYHKQLETNELDVMSFTRYALERWYEEHPDSYLFQNPGRSLSEHWEEWIHTPVFYGRNEIPGIKPYVFEEDNVQATGQNNILRHTCMGIAIGKECNYLVYHTKPKKELWMRGVEKASAIAIQNLIDDYALNNSVFGAGRIIQNAIIFCDTRYQFEALFQEILTGKQSRKTTDDTKSKKDGKRGVDSFGYPYSSMHIICLNGSGVQQLRALMYTTPHEYVMMETNQLCARNPEFMKTNDWIYPLAYNNKPVFLSHDMDYFRIKKALKDWQSGQRFYISCYPEQVKYMSILFPGAEFL